MVREEILEFCEYYKISIKKFIKENYGIFNDEEEIELNMKTYQDL